MTPPRGPGGAEDVGVRRRRRDRARVPARRPRRIGPERAARQRLGGQRRKAGRAAARRPRRATPIASQVSNGPSSQPNPHRIARSTSSIECGDVRCHAGRVEQQLAERVAQELADAVLAEEERAEARSAVASMLRAASIDGQARRLLGAVGHRLRIEGQDVVAGLLVEALTGLAPDPAALDQRATRAAGRRRRVALRRRQPLGQVAASRRRARRGRRCPGPERGALGPPDRRSGDRVDLFDREAVLERRDASAPRRTGRGGWR